MKTAIRETIIAGNCIYRRIISKRTPVEPGKKRAQKSEATIEAVERINQRAAERDLSIKINYNFIPGDYHLVLTYSKEPTLEEAKQNCNKFKRKYHKRGKELGIHTKLIESTEYLNKRVHHHIICTHMDLNEIVKLWPYGIVRTSVLNNSKDYRKLANYIIKETSKTFRSDNAANRRRYNCSRSIENPVVKREEVSSKQLSADPKPLPGYFIDQDSVTRYENPITDTPHLEYIMVALDATYSRKKWTAGHAVKYKVGRYDNWIRKHREKQIELITSSEE